MAAILTVRKLSTFFIFSVIFSLSAQPASIEGNKNFPFLRTQGSARQLVVDGEPFLILGGELGNSSASNMQYMKPYWSKLVALHLNTLLVPVYWELVEPVEDRFDFTLLDSLLGEARKHDLRLVLLWFGSWKNSMSCYVPLWIKVNQQRFARAQDKQGRGMEMLSAFSEANRAADAKAFAALMRHLCTIDGKSHTVVMIQVENEVGMIPEARDCSEAATKAFSEPVPRELMDYLQLHRSDLIPEFYKVWQKAGFKTSGTWQQVFGKSLGTDEIFMAWSYARYIDAVVTAGKAEYPLPMFVNAALIRPGYLPGQYPSAGPLPHLFDVWRAGAPSLDFFSPDIYFQNFTDWCQLYHRSGNPLFIPEASRGPQSAANVFYAIGQHDAIGFCPFSIESTEDPHHDPLAECYHLLSQLAPLILESQGTGKMDGVLLDDIHPSQEMTLGNYVITISHDFTFRWSSPDRDKKPWPRTGGIIISLGPDEYLIAGSGLIFTFKPYPADDQTAGFAAIDEGSYVNGQWVAGRRLNGDQSHQGRHARIPLGQFAIQRVKLYRYY